MKPLTEHIQQLYKAIERARDNPHYPKAYSLGLRKLEGMQEVARYIYFGWSKCERKTLDYAIAHLPEDLGIEV